MTTTRDWYKDAIVCELCIRSFFDGHDGAVGDFGGLAPKLERLTTIPLPAAAPPRPPPRLAALVLPLLEVNRV